VALQKQPQREFRVVAVFKQPQRVVACLKRPQRVVACEKQPQSEMSFKLIVYMYSNLLIKIHVT
jgi:hypothetical protein